VRAPRQQRPGLGRAAALALVLACPCHGAAPQSRRRCRAVAAVAAGNRRRTGRRAARGAPVQASAALAGAAVTVPLAWRNVACCARQGNPGAVGVVVNIGREYEKKGRRKLSAQDRKKLRETEIKRKINALKGDKAKRYLRQRDEERKRAAGAADEETDEEEEEEQEEGAAPSEGGRREGDGEAQAEWAFDRGDPDDYPEYRAATGPGPISDDSRALAVAELKGNGIASARAILDAAKEFKDAEEYEEAAELLEIARTRIDREMLERKLKALEAQSLDEEVLWLMALCYEEDGRLTIACDRYSKLMSVVTAPKDKARAQRAWSSVAFKLADKLMSARRFQEAYDIMVAVQEGVTRDVVGDDFVWEVLLYQAMVLKDLNRTEEAKEILIEVKRGSGRQRRAQATFILDVINVGPQMERNEEFHKVWEENFRLPDVDGYSQAPMAGGSYRGPVLQLTPRERAFREWTSKYWEERLKSPLYYSFLVLWVTWPFAIPVVSIANKGGIVIPGFS